MPDAPRKFSHKATPKFWFHYRQLPKEIRDIASKNYVILRENPRHPSLQFKKIGKVWSVRVGLSHRALATQIPEGFLWFWIGLHAAYDLKIK